MSGMTKEKYQTLPVLVLKDLAKRRGMKGVSTLKKEELIRAMLEQDAKDREAAEAAAAAGAAEKEEAESSPDRPKLTQTC